MYHHDSSICYNKKSWRPNSTKISTCLIVYRSLNFHLRNISPIGSDDLLGLNTADMFTRLDSLIIIFLCFVSFHFQSSLVFNGNGWYSVHYRCEYYHQSQGNSRTNWVGIKYIYVTHYNKRYILLVHLRPVLEFSPIASQFATRK